MTFKVTILGSSSAIPTVSRYPTAHVVNLHERFFLVDCGEGTQIRLKKYKFSFARIQHIFISHLHGDHYYGLIGLISTRNLLAIGTDLHIYAHSELKNLLQPMLDHLKQELQFKILFHPLNFKRSELIYSDNYAEVHSFPLQHSVPVCGFLFKERPGLPSLIKSQIEKLKIPISERKGIKEGNGYTAPDGTYYPTDQLTIPGPMPRAYAFCTDTLPQPTAMEFISGVNLLYHEATFQSDLADWAAKTFHSTARQAAEMALLAKAEQLIIGHFSNRYKSVSNFGREARVVFPNTLIAEEGQTYPIVVNR